MHIHGGAGAGVRRSAGKIPAVWSGGPALRPWVAVLPCGRTFVGLNPADTPSAGAPGGRSVWGGCPAAVWSGSSALRPCGLAIRRCGRTFVGVNPADTPSAGAPGGRSVWGGYPAAVWSGGSALRPDVCRSEPGGHAVGRRPWRPFRLGAARQPCVRRRQRAPIQSAWRASRRKTGMVASGAAAVTVRPPGWTAPVCSSVQSAPAGR